MPIFNWGVGIAGPHVPKDDKDRKKLLLAVATAATVAQPLALVTKKEQDKPKN